VVKKSTVENPIGNFPNIFTLIFLELSVLYFDFTVRLLFTAQQVEKIY